MTIHKFRNGIRKGHLYIAELNILLASEYQISRVPILDHDAFWMGFSFGEERFQEDLLEYVVFQNKFDTVPARLRMHMPFEKLEKLEAAGLIFDKCEIYNEIEALSVLKDIGT